MKLATPYHAGPLARSWLTAFHAAHTDDESALYRTLQVEHHADRGLRITATDTFVLATVWCPTDDDDPPLPDEAPTETWSVFDEDRRGDAFWRYVAKLAKAADKDDLDPPVVTGEVRKARPLSQLSLFGAVDQFELALSLNNGDETVALPLRDTVYPQWRNILAEAPDDDGTEFAVAPSTWVTMGKISSTFSTEDTRIVVRPSSDNPQMMRFHSDELVGEPVLSGAFSLVRTIEDVVE